MPGSWPGPPFCGTGFFPGTSSAFFWSIFFWNKEPLSLNPQYPPLVQEQGFKHPSQEEQGLRALVLWAGFPTRRGVQIKDCDGDFAKGPLCTDSSAYQFTTNHIIFQIGWVKTQLTNPISVLYLILRTANPLCKQQTLSRTLSCSDLLSIIGFFFKNLTSVLLFLFYPSTIPK